VGYSTFSVSLPKEWVKESGLKQGDLVMFLPERDGSLKLIPSSMVERKTQTEEYIINSDVCNEPGMLARLIVGNYTLGRDAFQVVSSTKIRREHVDEVHKITRRLMGLGIVQEAPERINLQCSVDPTKFKIDMLIRRLSVIASTMNVEAMKAFADSNRELAEEAIHREDEADMIYWLTMRLILSAQRDRIIADKIGLEEPSQVLYYALVAKNLELIADHTEDIARRTIEFHNSVKEKTSKNMMNRIINVGEMTHNVFLKAIDCVFRGDIQVANNVLEITKVLRSEHERLMKELPELSIQRIVLLDLAKIADIGAGIAVIAISKALEKPSEVSPTKGAKSYYFQLKKGRILMKQAIKD